MTTKRLFILLVVMLAGLSSVLFLPRQLGFQPVGVKLELPKMVGGIWYGEDMAVSEKERKVLGEETEFARKAYRNARGYIITASVVLSGQDMNTSIHRPERCMPAQGFAVIDNRPVAVPLREGTMPATRLLNVRNIPADETSGPISNYNLTYYWFVGHNDITASHFARTWFDIRDRLVHGYNQRWAYVTVAASLPPDAMKDPRIEKVMDEWLQTFIKQLMPQIRIAEETPAAG
jgi:EpsI family protein